MKSASRVLARRFFSCRDSPLINNDGVLLPQFRSDQGPPPGALMQGLGFSTLNGLPSSNGDFGARSITHTVLGTNIGTADIEVFYQTAVATHPANGTVKYCEEPWSVSVRNTSAHLKSDNVLIGGFPFTPNWFYYYSQAWSNPWGITVAYVSDPTAYFLRSVGFDDHVHVGTLAHGDTTVNAYGAALFALLPGASYVTYVGEDNVRGFDSYARTVTHECVHKRLYEAVKASATDNDTDPTTLVNVGDGIADITELQVGLNPNTPNTTGYDNDNEVFCRMTEHSVPLVEPIADWASDGINKGAPLPPNLSQRIVRSTPGYNPNTLNLPNAYAYIP